MTHEEAQAHWLLADDGALDEPREAALREHLASCAECRSVVDQMAAADRALRAWGGAAPSAGAPAVPVAPEVRRWWPVAIAAAIAGIALGSVGGFVAGRGAVPAGTATVSPVTDPRPTFVLLLEEPAVQWPPPAPLARPGYMEWMDSLIANGLFADGERLAEDDGWYLGADGRAVPMGSREATASNFSGLFVVRAADYDEAITIARGSPHLRYGGIMVRRSY